MNSRKVPGRIRWGDPFQFPARKSPDGGHDAAPKCFRQVRTTRIVSFVPAFGTS
jgi:hypothetical protein